MANASNGEAKKGSVDYSAVVWFICTALFVGLILLHAGMTGDVSNSESEGLRSFINSFLTAIGLSKFSFLNENLRKFAHVVQSLVLGVLLTCSFNAATKNPLKGLLPIFLSVAGIAILGEKIQLETVGRVASVDDIILDILSASIGICISVIFLSLFRHASKKH